MKLIVPLLFAGVLLAAGSCKQKAGPDDEPVIVTEVATHALHHKWIFKESYTDPGNHTEVWSPVTQTPEAYIQFNADNSVQCNYEGFTSPITSYEIINAKQIKLHYQSGMVLTFGYLIDGANLLLTPPCIEGCGIKLVRSTTP